MIPYASVIEAPFSNKAWLDTLVFGGGNGWEVKTRFNFSAILLRKSGNFSPKTMMSPIIKLLHGCYHTITIPVEDADGDDIRCRWAQKRLGECGGVCMEYGISMRGRVPFHTTPRKSQVYIIIILYIIIKY